MVNPREFGERGDAFELPKQMLNKMLFLNLVAIHEIELKSISSYYVKIH